MNSEQKEPLVDECFKPTNSSRTSSDASMNYNLYREVKPDQALLQQLSVVKADYMLKVCLVTQKDQLQRHLSENSPQALQTVL